ncbi:hypothetical protein BH09PSE1_BH09PSE1_05260 [soil metagenome]
MGSTVGLTEFEIHPGREDWFWMVFDSEGEEVRGRRTVSQADALSCAMAVVARREEQFSLRVVSLKMASINFSPRRSVERRLVPNPGAAPY